MTDIGQVVPQQTSDLDTHETIGQHVRANVSDLAATGSTAGEIAGPAVRLATIDWDTFTGEESATFSAPQWHRFTACETDHIAGLIRIVSALYIAGSTAGEVLLDDIGQLQPLTQPGQIIHD